MQSWRLKSNLNQKFYQHWMTQIWLGQVSWFVRLLGECLTTMVSTMFGHFIVGWAINRDESLMMRTWHQQC
jgi:hypothetical protein